MYLILLYVVSISIKSFFWQIVVVFRENFVLLQQLI